jgi:ssDNA-binding Zn-finger/Zn-ribbon topoisomerase 1
MMKQICQTCNGTGQISFFKGVSRFLLSCEECPECAGLGFRPEPGSPLKPVGRKSRKVGRKSGRKS